MFLTHLPSAFDSSKITMTPVLLYTLDAQKRMNSCYENTTGQLFVKTLNTMYATATHDNEAVLAVTDPLAFFVRYQFPIVAGKIS